MARRSLPPELTDYLVNCIGGPWRRIAYDNFIFYGGMLYVFLPGLRTSRSIGIGDFFDLLDMGYWSHEVGFSRMLIPPIMLRDFFDESDSPYAPLSLEGLDWLYLRVQEVLEVRNSGVAQHLLSANGREINRLNSTFRIDYPGTKRFKDMILRPAFADFRSYPDRHPRVQSFLNFCRCNQKWLGKLANFVALEHFCHRNYRESFWQKWPGELQNPQNWQVGQILNDPNLQEEFLYQKFLQWETEEQLRYVLGKLWEIWMLVIGDFVYLPAQNSHNVYFDQSAYHLDLAAGWPPDPDFSRGQKWGNNPRNYKRILENSHLYEEWIEDYLRSVRLMKDRGFHGVRLDGVFSIFNPYVIPQSDNPKYPQLYTGWRYSGNNQSLYLPWGRRILEHILSIGLETYAENLGYERVLGVDEILRQLHISGMPVFRWQRKWDDNYSPFIHPCDHEILDCLGFSSHDWDLGPKHLTNLAHPEYSGYGNHKAMEFYSERQALAELCGWHDLPEMSTELYCQYLKTGLSSSAWQFVISIAELLCLDQNYRRQYVSDLRINKPGTSNTADRKINWNCIIYYLQELMNGSERWTRWISDTTRSILVESGRA